VIELLHMSRQIKRVAPALREGGVRLLVSKGTRVVGDRLSMLPARRALRRQLAATESLDDYIEAIYRFRYRNVTLAPSQIRSEIKSFLEVVHDLSPRTLLEIGTGLGGTTLLLAQVAAPDAIVVTIDLPTGPSPQRLLDAALRPGQKIYVLRRDSHQSETVAKVRSIIESEQLDLLFIDGDHSYDGVQEDFRLYSSLVRGGGWIAFHDIVPGPVEFVGGVPEFWRQLKRGHSTREFVHDPGQQGLGIGLLRADPR
jgi:predicted O-methyltransferase YrrM